MPADPSTIPASATVTNITVEPLQVAGLPSFAVSEARTIDFSAFVLAQRSLVWNALYNARAKNLITAPAITFDVDELATGHQSTINRGGHGIGGAILPVPGGLGLPVEAVCTSLLDAPFVLCGYRFDALGERTIAIDGLPINQQASVWNALIVARDRGHITSPDLTVAVPTGFTGHQDVGNSGGQGPGGQVSFLLQTPYVGITVNGVPLTVQGEDITVQGV